MKYPVYIPWFEPRTRKRFWTAIRRAKSLAKEALSEPKLPATFVVSIHPPHVANHNRPHPLLWVVGHINGAITSIVSTCSLP